MSQYRRFWTFCKGYSKAKWLQNGRFWERSSDQPTRWLICPHVISKWRDTVMYFIPTNMVRTRVRGSLRMCKLNIKTAVHLDVVPERCTERFAPRFPPVDRFCELRFRYLSSPTGREGEISRPLDHTRQIPFIHPARLINSTNFHIYRTVF